ncbi:MAG TPA: type VI secretion system baseplate subunit TssE [Chromatiaceae bacterium]|nr:type VI secretion system baseplate subunit TssE [Chromatiaceae bacterium]
MAELRQQDKLQPSLLDRLTDDAPDSKTDRPDQRVLTLRKLRDSVKRDLAWLLNATNLSSVQSLERFPEVERSVLNYGMPDISGLTVSDIDTGELELAVRRVILNFEPRILPHTVEVKPLIDEQQMNSNALAFEIEGLLWAQPAPLQIMLKTELDLELGEVTVSDSSGST